MYSDGDFLPGLVVDKQSMILEGLPLEKKIVKGSPDPLPTINDGEVLIEVDPMSGQKTGFFLEAY